MNESFSWISFQLDFSFKLQRDHFDHYLLQRLASWASHTFPALSLDDPEPVSHHKSIKKIIQFSTLKEVIIKINIKIENVYLSFFFHF